VTSLVTASTLSRRAESASTPRRPPSLFFEGNLADLGELAARARRAAAGFVGAGGEAG
jgi:hypothetical protein